MKKILHTLFLLTFSIVVSAQSRISGKIYDLQQKPVSNVIVKLMNGNKTISFCSSNAQGEYTMEVKEKEENKFVLQFNHISYESVSEQLVWNGKSIELDMILTPKIITLKEVMVRANPLRQQGDTLAYHLASFLGKGDLTLEDGIKRLPGVEVSKTGTISYMGYSISQFNIEGLDLLGGKYNLATRNIPADYVTMVEIVRNHHSRRVDKDIPSNEVSMNIKLNKKAKFKPFGQEEGGLGVMQDGKDELLALLGATGMLFTDSLQVICSLKGGNYKDFAKADMIDHFSGSTFRTTSTNLFSGFDGGSPPQGEYLHQRNGMITLNGITRLDSVVTLKVNADYSYHRATHDISQKSTYLSDGNANITVAEQTSPLSEWHLPKLTINYEKNSDLEYLNERLMIRGMFENNEGNVLANQHQVEQRRRASSFEARNDLHWSDRTPKGTRRHLNASVSFKRTPTLRLSFVNDGAHYGQTAQSSTLTTDVSSSFSIPIGKVFSINLPASVNAVYDNLETNRIPSYDANHIHGWSFTPKLNPGFELRSRNRRFYSSIGLGAMLKGLYYNKMSYTKPVLNPSLSISLDFSANNRLKLNTSYSTNIGDMMTLLTEPMQVDYRTVRTSSGIIGESNNWSASAKWNFQEPMQYYTISISASHNQNKRNTLYSQHIDGIDVSNSSLLRDTRTKNTSFSVSGTKSIPSLSTKLLAEANYGFGDGEQAVKQEVIKTRNYSYSLHGNAEIFPLSWFELKYDFRYHWSSSKYARTKNTITSLTHVGEVHVFPVSELDISANFNHVRRQITTDQYKNMVLFNAAVQYKAKRMTLCLELDNLLNQRNYSYTVFDGINTYSYEYGLCGRAIMLRTIFKL